MCDPRVTTRTIHLKLKLQLFEKVKTQRGLPVLKKAVTAVSGDVALPGLGLSPEDRKMLTENVTIVYHAAATVRYR